MKGANSYRSKMIEELGSRGSMVSGFWVFFHGIPSHSHPLPFEGAYLGRKKSSSRSSPSDYKVSYVPSFNLKADTEISIYPFFDPC
jgi:hypothetical protein